MYKAGLVPVGEDQVAHVELTREVARRFNYTYGREAGFEEKPKQPLLKWVKNKPNLTDLCVKSIKKLAIPRL